MTSVDEGTGKMEFTKALKDFKNGEVYEVMARNDNFIPDSMIE